MPMWHYRLRDYDARAVNRNLLPRGQPPEKTRFLVSHWTHTTLAV